MYPEADPTPFFYPEAGEPVYACIYSQAGAHCIWIGNGVEAEPRTKFNQVLVTVDGRTIGVIEGYIHHYRFRG